MMFRRRPELPVRAEQREWIENSFELLTQLFGSERLQKAPLVLPSEQFFPLKWEPTEEWANYAFDRVCMLMGVERERVQLEFMVDPWADLRQAGVHLETTRNAAGLYSEIQSTSLAQITIKRSLFDKPEKMVAVMAHELAHVLLLGDGKITRDRERMEELTDLMTVFSGFGVLSANSAHVHQSGSRGWSVETLGYLSPREYGYALAVFARARNETAPSWDRELSTNVRAYMRATLDYFKTDKS